MHHQRVAVRRRLGDNISPNEAIRAAAVINDELLSRVFRNFLEHDAAGYVGEAARGRHRAPADPGRHRAADTGLFAVVTADSVPETVAARTPAPVRGTCTEETPAVAARGGWTVPEGVEPDLLTRPMRLADHMPHSRRPRVDGSRSI